eukprot:403342369
MGRLLISCIFIFLLGAFVTFLAFSVISYEQEVPELDCYQSSLIEACILNIMILSAYCSFITFYHTLSFLCLGKILLPPDVETFCAKLLTGFLTGISPLLILLYFVVLTCYMQSLKLDFDECGKDGYQLNIVKILIQVVYTVGALVLLIIVYKIIKCIGCTCNQGSSGGSSSSGNYNNNYNSNSSNNQPSQNRDNSARDQERLRQQQQRDQENYRRQQQQQAEQRLREQQQALIKQNNRVF